jgi:hypothetical protein
MPACAGTLFVENSRPFVIASEARQSRCKQRNRARREIASSHAAPRNDRQGRFSAYA